jgi:hypothetical protein
MVRLLKQLVKGEKGQALPIVLGLLVIGGLTLIPSIGYTTASLKNSRMLDEGVRGTYAADAGIENALWSLVNSMSPSTQLSDNVNQMEVTIQTDNVGDYTLYLGELIEPGGHSDYLDIVGEMVWDGGANAYNYTVTITWQAAPGTPPIKLEEVGARIPIGYSYQSGSAANFVENLSLDEPDETLDAQGAYLLNWVLSPPLPSLSDNITVQTQAFHITGEGSEENHYAWVVASREDVGAVGEIAGTFYRITATAAHPENGKTTARIIADIIIELGTPYIMSWQIIN